MPLITDFWELNHNRPFTSTATIGKIDGRQTILLEPVESENLRVIASFVNEQLKSEGAAKCDPKHIKHFKQFAKRFNERIAAHNAWIAHSAVLCIWEHFKRLFNPWYTVEIAPINLELLWGSHQQGRRQVKALNQNIMLANTKEAESLTQEIKIVHDAPPILDGAITSSSLMAQTQLFDLSINPASVRGRRPSMEDTFLVHPSPLGTFIAVFDGHGSDAVSTYLKRHFYTIFEKYHRTTQHDIKLAFEKTFARLNTDVQPFSEVCGSTAAVCFIPQNKARVYTAVIGDTMAYRFRADTPQLLSKRLNWKSPEEQERFEREMGRPLSRTELELGRVKQLNISRSIGYGRGGEAISAEPVVSRADLRGGDSLFIGSDGFFDFMPVDNIDPKLGSERLVTEALHTYSSLDNITLIRVEASDRVDISPASS